MRQTPVLTPLEPKPVSKSGITPACNLKTRLSKRRREDEEYEEEPSSTRAAKGHMQERDEDKSDDIEDGTTDRESDRDTPSEQDDAELRAHPIPYNKYLPHFPLNATPSPQIYDGHLQHASIRPKDLYDLIAYHHAMHNAAHLHEYYLSTKHGKRYTTTTTHTFVHNGPRRGFH